MGRLLWLAAAAGLGCSTTHGIRPLGKGGVSVDASLGGPITQVFGAPVPLPLTTLGATVGVAEGTDVHAAVHPTGLIFGVGAVDVGVSQQFLPPAGARPRLMGDLTLLGAGGDRDESQAPKGGFRFFAQPTVTASWDWGKRRYNSVYTGLTAFIQPGDAWGVVAGWNVGNRFAVGRSHIDVELRWLQPWASNDPLVPQFYAPANQGAVAFQVGYGLEFGTRKEAR